MERLSRQDWLDEGYLILKEKGAAGLTIEALTARLNKTKGSFYHHFKNRDGFLLSLLTHWEESQTLEIISSSSKEKSYQRMNEKLLALSTRSYSAEVEVAIRAWALRDEMAGVFQKRVDENRVAFLRQMFSHLTDNPDEIATISLIRYCFYIGSQQIIPALDPQTYEKLLNALSGMFEQHLTRAHP
jgi:AcrR family transcriptional regulator